MKGPCRRPTDAIHPGTVLARIPGDFDTHRTLCRSAARHPLEDWRAALDVSHGQKAHGKLILLPSSADPFV
jgi:hypothetical protein